MLKVLIDTNLLVRMVTGRPASSPLYCLWREGRLEGSLAVVDRKMIRRSVFDVRTRAEADADYGARLQVEWTDVLLGTWLNVPEHHFLRGLARRAGGDWRGAFLDFHCAYELQPRLPLFRMARVVAAPSIPGKNMSIKITSGRSSSHKRKASSPFWAVPTTSISLKGDSKKAIPWRTSS